MKKMNLSRRAFSAWCMAVLVAVMGLGLAGCGSSGATAGSTGTGSAATETAKTVTFTDSVGRKVEVPANIDKIVPSGHTANMVLLTLAPEKMVGLSQEMTDAQKRYLGDKVADDLPVLGAAFGAKGDLNKEAVAASGAQILIDTGEAKDGIAEDLDALQEQLGIPCVFVESTLDKWGDAYRTLGKLLGCEERADELADYCDKAYSEVSDVMDAMPESERANVLFATGDTGTNVLAKGSFQAGVVDMLANNVAVVDSPSGKGSGNESSLEQIAAWNPDVILFGSMGGASAYDTASTDPAWAKLPAIASGSYCEVPSTPYGWLNNPPTVNQVLGMQWLSHVLYPDKFDDSVEDVVSDYFKTFYGYKLSDSELFALLARATMSTDGSK